MRSPALREKASADWPSRTPMNASARRCRGSRAARTARRRPRAGSARQRRARHRCGTQARARQRPALFLSDAGILHAAQPDAGFRLVPARRARRLHRLSARPPPRQDRDEESGDRVSRAQRGASAGGSCAPPTSISGRGGAEYVRLGGFFYRRLKRARELRTLPLLGRSSSGAIPASGIVVLSAHFGNFELLARAHAMHGHQISLVHHTQRFLPATR